MFRFYIACPFDLFVISFLTFVSLQFTVVDVGHVGLLLPWM